MRLRSPARAGRNAAAPSDRPCAGRELTPPESGELDRSSLDRHVDKSSSRLLGPVRRSLRAGSYSFKTITFDFVHDEARHAYVTVRNEYVAKELYELYATEPSLAKAPAGQAGDERASRKSLPARRAISLDGKRVFVRLPKALQPSAQAALVVVVAAARSVPARGLASRACCSQV